ncbi:MAG: tRNA pseudouridine(38-40) synthase TruA [Alphaproteobacteria bacterium]|nr:tRNA pseudouridine(38-40) synthase TruA [Alphaproteobacteria bacterium]
MRYKITIEYDGTNTLGWQRQLDGPSIQEYLENAVNKLLPNNINSKIKPQTEPTPHASAKTIQDHKSSFEVKNEDVDTQHRTGAYIDVREDPSSGSTLQASAKTRFIEIQGSGRTDAGVHALGQVAHFDLERDIEDWKLRDAINFHLREQNAPVVVLNVEKVSSEFNARFSAQKRGYIYRILNRRSPAIIEQNRVWWVPIELDINAMQEGAKHLLGNHDFSSFRAAACQAKSPIKTLDKIDIYKKGDEIVFEVEARSFLHHQVRNIVGTLKMVGDKSISPSDIKTILEAKDRRKAGPTAPACGLYLNKIWY